MKDFNFLKSEPYLKPLKARTQQLCATKRSTVEGQGKALRIARNPDSRGVGESHFIHRSLPSSSSRKLWATLKKKK